MHTAAISIGVLLGALALASLVGASSGALSFASCFSQDGVQGCKTPRRPSLGSVNGVAASQDGGSVYVTSSRVLNEFSRGRNGSLRFESCIANRGSYGCAKAARRSLGYAGPVAVSPDGRSIYVAGGYRAITTLKRRADGTPVYAGCIADGGGHGCKRMPHPSLQAVGDLAVSPDGRSLYATGAMASALTTFRRTSTGALKFRGCFSNGGAHGCQKPPRGSLEFADGVSVSPDGRSVYVAVNRSIVWFTRVRSGSLRFAGCIADRGAYRCRRARHDSLKDSLDVGVSPDGRSVYVASESSHAISWFDRSRRGALTFAGCIANRGASGCRKPRHSSLSAPRAVAVSGDGESVYVGSLHGALTRFDRKSGGGLVYRHCWSQGDVQGCSRPPLHGIRALALSPDGTSLYVAGGQMVSIFRRQSPMP